MQKTIHIANNGQYVLLNDIQSIYVFELTDKNSLDLLFSANNISESTSSSLYLN